MAPGSADGGRRGTSRRPLPFAIHQVCEYAIAVALVVTSVHVAGGGLLVAGGIAFGLLAATGRGPTGVAPVCPPRLHAALDVVVALCLALAPILPALRPDLTGILTVEFAAVGWLRVTTLTSFTRRTPVTTPDGQAVPPPGRTAGDTDATAPAPRSSSRSAILGGARHLGRGAGRARRAWKRSTGPAD